VSHTRLTSTEFPVNDLAAIGARRYAEQAVAADDVYRTARDAAIASTSLQTLVLARLGGSTDRATVAELWVVDGWRTLRVHGAGVDLRGAGLRGAQLNGARLARADLRDADLAGADLEKADLSDANLCGAILRGSTLYRASLRGADLTEAELCRADLQHADLQRTVLHRTALRGADLWEAYLWNVDLGQAFVDGVDLTRANNGNSTGRAEP
jgi:uncharacterized protein YjbI with pentapeptide repeats